MKQRPRLPILVSLGLVSVLGLAASVWLFRAASPVQQAAAPENCGSADSCSAGIAETPHASSEPHAAPGAPRERPRPSDGEPVDAADLREEADRLLAAGEFARGLELLRKATYAEPSARNHGDLGDLLARATDFHEALIHLRAAAELEPQNADRWIALANGYYRTTDLGEAWKAEKRAKQAEPGLELGRDARGMRVRKGDSAPRTP